MAVEHKKTFVVGGAVAEWSKALLLREKINENQKDPRFAPRPGQPLKRTFVVELSNNMFAASGYFYIWAYFHQMATAVSGMSGLAA